jgi:uncharacterized protein YkvS
MAGFDIELKRGEVRDIEALLQDGTGTALPMTGAVVKFQMGKKGVVLKIDRQATVVDTATAHVRFTTTALETDTAGTYKAEWRVSYAGGDVIVPESQYLNVKIWEDLA